MKATHGYYLFKIEKMSEYEIGKKFSSRQYGHDLQISYEENRKSLLTLHIESEVKSDNKKQAYEQLRNIIKTPTLDISKTIRHFDKLVNGMLRAGSSKKKEKYHEALECYERSLEIDRINETALANIGLVYIKLGEYEKALEYYSKNLKISSEQGNVAAENISNFNIGIIHSIKGDNKVAYQHLEKSLRISKHIGDDVGTSAVYEVMGDISQKEKNFYSALQNYEKAKETNYKTRDKNREKRIDKKIFETHRQMNDPSPSNVS